MSLRVGEVVIDCAEHGAVVDFWQAALDYERTISLRRVISDSEHPSPLFVDQHDGTGGVVTQWVPLYESNLAAVKSEVATFLKVFPNGTVWANNLTNKPVSVEEQEKLTQQAVATCARGIP